VVIITDLLRCVNCALFEQAGSDNSKETILL
jgi:hypothetical protein